MKKEEILLSAIKLIAENGYHNTSTALIAKEAGVASGLIFYHFKNKEGVLKEVVEYIRARAEAVLRTDEGKDARQQLKNFVNNIIKQLDDKGFWFLYHSLLFQPGISEILKTSLMPVMEEYQNRLIEIFRAMGQADPVQTMIDFEAKRTGIVINYLIMGDAYPVKKMFKSLTQNL